MLGLRIPNRVLVSGSVDVIDTVKCALWSLLVGLSDVVVANSERQRRVQLPTAVGHGRSLPETALVGRLARVAFVRGASGRVLDDAIAASGYRILSRQEMEENLAGSHTPAVEPDTIDTGNGR
ncbi:hypothetical protein BV898_19665 [Hypsibius exemplaris]|uniref:Uncharacterized protein n=1 Tax=Hypsibius exemplaris TaxID=2072580 RepID=A0A9X6RPU7_HYPEX|nr:hypothetical protein BV898_19665 [Hypsibius exemplaris]